MDLTLTNNNFRSVIKTFSNNAPATLNYFQTAGHRQGECRRAVMYIYKLTQAYVNVRKLG